MQGLRVAVMTALSMAAVGVVCGVLYSVGGFFVDLFTVGLNWGTALAFGALVGMPVSFAAFGLVVGGTGVLVVGGIAAVTDRMRGSSEAPTSVFSSRRERRLWTWTAVVVMGIYSTLGLAATLADVVPDPVAAVIFLGAMLLIGITVLTQGLKTRPGGVEIGVGLGIAVVYIMLFFRMTAPERSHLIEYSVVAVLIYEALTERASQGRRVPAVALLALLATALVGALDEGIQLLLPRRHFDPVDILFNSMAAAMAVAGMTVVGWVRRVYRRSRATPTGNHPAGR